MHKPPTLLSTTRRSLVPVLAWSVGTIATSLAIFGFIADFWLFDLASQLRIVDEMVLIVCVLLFLLLRSRLGTAVMIAAAVINGLPIASLFMRAECTLPESAQRISILNFNSEFRNNDRYDLIQKLISQRKPDIVALVEINQEWLDALHPAMQAYPYKRVLLEGPGMALYSSHPIDRFEVRHFGKSHHPRLSATISVDGQPVQLMIAHPTTPKSGAGYIERNEELAVLREEMKAMPPPKILIGDLNCGPWSSAFLDLFKAGLRDSQQGFGPQPSWPARHGRVFGLPIPPVVPIDHVLVSNDICALNRTVGPPVGSDHLPVFVTLTVPRKDASANGPDPGDPR